MKKKFILFLVFCNIVSLFTQKLEAGDISKQSQTEGEEKKQNISAALSSDDRPLKKTSGDKEVEKKEKKIKRPLRRIKSENDIHSGLIFGDHASPPFPTNFNLLINIAKPQDKAKISDVFDPKKRIARLLQEQKKTTDNEKYLEWFLEDLAAEKERASQKLEKIKTVICLMQQQKAELYASRIRLLKAITDASKQVAEKRSAHAEPLSLSIGSLSLPSSKDVMGYASDLWSYAAVQAGMQKK